MSLGPLMGKPTLRISVLLNPARFYSFESKPFLNSKLDRELGSNCGTELVDIHSKSNCLATLTKPKLRFLSRFGRVNGGGRGSRRELPFVDGRLINPGAPLQTDSVSS